MKLTTKADIVNLSETLIKIESTVDNIDKQHKCIDIIIDEFKDIFKATKYTANDHPIVVLSSNDSKESDITISGHIDVVPGEPETFAPTQVDGKLFGRGAYDMKAGLVACMYAVADYKRNGGEKDIAIMITSDEETGGDGTQYLLKQQAYKTNFAIIVDGGTDSQIVLKQKGVMHLKVTLEGKSAHGAYPWVGDNAITKAHKLHEYLTERYPQPHQGDQWQTSILLSRIESTNSINQVPGLAHLYLDVRYIDKQHYDDILKAIIEYTGNKDSVTIIAEHSLFYSDLDDPNVKKLAKSVQRFNSKPVTFEYENGASDAVFFTEHNIPAALFRPVGANLHQKDEWVDIESLYTTYEIILDFLNNND